MLTANANLSGKQLVEPRLRDVFQINVKCSSCCKAGLPDGALYEEQKSWTMNDAYDSGSERRDTP